LEFFWDAGADRRPSWVALEERTAKPTLEALEPLADHSKAKSKSF